ncbi:MAG: rhomboid family intramembrane serine protease [Luteolibacter sp.]
MTGSLTPVVKWLLIVNIAVYFIDLLNGHRTRALGSYAIESALMEFRLWEFLTFQFLHGSVGHLLFNMVALFFFGPYMERWWGSRKFLWFYLLSGCAGAVFFTLLTLAHILPSGFESVLIGASAGIYGILIGVGVIAPALRVALLFPPIELSMRQLAIALMVISTVVILLGIGGNEGGEAGHLGGAILGYFLVRRPGWLGAGGPAAPPRHRRPQPPKLRPRSTAFRDADDEVDRILEKISSEGFQSLSQEERDILKKASERQDPP